MPVPPRLILRRFWLWLTVCIVSAAPSFALAISTVKAEPGGMVAAVLLFAILYTLATSTERFEAFHRRPFVRDTLYVGYGLRLLLSLLTAAVLVDRSSVAGVAMAPDMFCGILSMRIGSLLMGGNASGINDAGVETFLGAFVTTCVQGAILNAVVFVVMGVAYGLQRAMRKSPDHVPRGFDVVPIAEAVTPLPPDPSQRSRPA